jgi:PadR family transcriptional regulator PadR
MPEKPDVLQGTLALMVLKTLDLLGPLHSYGVARRIEQISNDLLAINQGTLYPLLLKLEHEGAIASDWGASQNNRRARFYRLTRPATSNCRPKPATGSKRPPSSHDSSLSKGRNCHEIPAALFRTPLEPRSRQPR